MKTLSCLLLGASFATFAFVSGCGGDVSESTTKGAGGSAGDAAGAAGADTGGTGGTGTAGTAGTGGTGTAGTAGTGGTGTAGTAGTGTGGDNGMPSDVYPAPHPSPPKVVSLGGPVLASPQVYPVFFSNDDAVFTSTIADFTSKVFNTQYWLAAVQEYGVGAATAMPPIQSPDAPSGTIDDAKIQSWLAGKLNANDPAFPVADDNTLIALYYPKNVTITLQGAQSCTQFGGYHNNLKLDAAHGNRLVAYAVMPHCAGFGGMNEQDAMTASASHEFIEAATDPYPQDDPAYAQVDDAHLFWLFALGGGETGDMCAQQGSSFVKFPELPQYTVQRGWSNQAAMGSHDPCVPGLPGQAYFNSAPVMPDNIQVNIGQIVNFKGVSIPVGQSKTVEVDLFSDAKTSGPWTVKAYDGQQLQGGSPELALSFDKNSGVNGEKLHLTIKVLKASQFQAEIFYLISTLDNQQNIWIGFVGN